jgi:Holliday junction resolvase-like predicted endonuclease
MFARLVFAAVQFRARHGLAELPPPPVAPPAPLTPPRTPAGSAATPSPARLGSPNSKLDPDVEGETLPLFSAPASVPNPQPSPQAALEKKERARRTGIRGETYAYWFLRAQGYVMVARNFMTPGIKGEIDIVGYDGPTLAFVEVKTRSASENPSDNAPPELAVDEEKQQNVTRLATRFSAARRVDLDRCRFDVVAIETRPGRPPIVRLHKGVDTTSRQLPLRQRPRPA